MIVYIAVFAVFILILWGAYRSLGAPATSVAAPEVVAAMVRRDLAATLRTLTSPDEDLAATGKAARRTAAAATQHLASIPAAEDDLDPAVGLLGAAAEDCAWAGRLMEQDAYPGNLGLQAAVATLLDHAQRCLDQVALASADLAPTG